jgi:hypothetical protein
MLHNGMMVSGIHPMTYDAGKGACLLRLLMHTPLLLLLPAQLLLLPLLLLLLLPTQLL